MASNLPIKFQELLQLTNVGISPDAIGFATLTMESPKYICIREQQQEKSAVVIIDMANPTQPIRRSISADSVIMCPDKYVLALKAGQQLQVFNMETKQQLKSHQMSEPVVFWKWINGNTIGLVTANAVYHWSLDGGSPQKVFDRHNSLSDCQIINYRADKSEKWLCLVGIASRDGKIVGAMQLYSVNRNMSQALEGHCCSFASFTPDGAKSPSTLFSFAKKTETESKLYIIEVDKPEDSPGYQKKAVDLYFPPEATGDFPVAMQIAEKYGIIYVITKFGFLHLFDIESGTLIYRNRISSDTIFVTTLHEASGGTMGVDRKGRVLLVAIDQNNLVPYVCNNLNNYELAIKMASRGDLPGAEDLFANQFNRLFQQGQYAQAAKVAAESPQGSLRTQKTIQLFQQLPAQSGQASPLLQYFGVLLEKGKLNKLESLELARPVLQQGRIQLIEKWLQEDKLTCSEELGDLVKPHDLKLGLSIYYRGAVHPKVIMGFAESGQYDKIVAYAQKVGYQPDWKILLNQLIQTNPDAAASFASNLLSQQKGAVDINSVVDALMSRGMIQQTTSLLLDVLKENKPEEAALQTKLLEINLINAPTVADAILGNQMFTHYDRKRIAQLCEKAGLFQRALEHYTDLNDIKRVMSNTSVISPEFLVDFFSRLSVEESLECLKHLLRVNIRQNLQIVVQICSKYSDQLGAKNVIELFETFKSSEGLYYYLGAAVNTSEDPLIHDKYIMAAARTGQFREVERMCRESNNYTPDKIRDFLKETKLADQLPLIIVCDRFDYVPELTTYLYKNNLSKYIEAYVSKINPMNAPQVFGALIDVGCNEDYIKNLLMLHVRNMCPIDSLVEAAEKRNKLKLILPWLEARRQEGNTEPELHNALAKVYIDTNRNPEEFLNENAYYDSLVVGKYCEKRDPHLAFVAYKRGLCNDELLEVTNKNSLFKHQARYLVERQDLDLYAKVLSEENEYRRKVIDQIVQTALPEVKNPDEVSTAVRAFMNAGLPNELIELLDKVVMDSKKPEFAKNKSLQNLLILTAIKADKSRVMNYINRLEDYDASDIANVAIGAGLYEEAFAIFKKYKLYADGIDVLLNHVGDLDRASEFADRINEKPVFSKLGQAQLKAKQVSKAIASFIKADDHEFFNDVILEANDEGCYEDLAKYLEMCIKKTKEPRLESELVFCYAKIGKLAELEEFITTPGCCADILDTGERCFSDGLYEAAKILFANVDSYARLASALVKLEEFQQAVEAARKANSTRTWKEVLVACVENNKFKLAENAGLYLVTQADELEELVYIYESRGHFEELIQLLEKATNQEEASVGLFTELASLYSKYKESKLMDYIKAHHDRIHIPRVIHNCQMNSQWPELTFLQIKYSEFDDAAMTMINHPEAWEHVQFKDVISKLSTSDICYKAVQFYVQEHPMIVNDLLSIMKDIDHSRVVQLVRKLGHLPLIKSYMATIQDKDIAVVNEALNELYIEEGDYESLRHSIDHFSNFEALELAQKLEKHELLEFRRIAAYLYQQQGRFNEAVALSKQDKLYKDAIASAAASQKAEVAEDLLNYFVDNDLKECFAACLYTCYDIIQPDVALELAWKHKILDSAFPYFIQVVREYTSKVDSLVKEKEKKKKEAEKKSEQPDSFVPEEMFINQPALTYYDPNTLPGGYGQPGFGQPGYGGPSF